MFKKQFSYEKRLKESSSIIIKYPDKVPIIVEQGPGNKLPTLDKKKYLVHKDLTLSQFQYIIRKRIKINENEAIFLFIDSTIPCSSTTIGSLYKYHKDVDNFLYITYIGENVYGFFNTQLSHSFL